MKMATALLVIALAFGACSEAASESQGSGETAAPSPAVEASPEPAPAEEPDNLVSTTQGVFNPETIELTAGEKTELPFVNNDPAPHNISIYVKKGGKQLFEGKDVGSEERVTYQIPPLKKGRYFFMCDIHPPMEGTVVVR